MEIWYTKETFDREALKRGLSANMGEQFGTSMRVLDVVPTGQMHPIQPDVINVLVVYEKIGRVGVVAAQFALDLLRSIELEYAA